MYPVATFVKCKIVECEKLPRVLKAQRKVMNAVQTAALAGWWMVLVTSKVADVVPLFKTVFNNLTILLLNNGAVGSPGWPPPPVCYVGNFV